MNTDLKFLDFFNVLEKMEQKEKKAALNVQLIDQINVKRETAKRDKQNIIDLERSFISSSLKRYEEDLQNKLREKVFSVSHFPIYFNFICIFQRFIFFSRNIIKKK